ncbi:MAG: type II secretion system secretin GspD [Burkholderiaceae bacterium]
MQTPMKKHSQWQHLRATAILLLSVAVIPPAWPATDNEATLNFVGADIESVIKAIGHYTNTTFIIDPRVKGTINLVAEKALTKAQAFSLLASALRLQGYAMVAGDGYTKVVPEADAKLQATPIQVRGDAMRLKGDQIGTRVFRLNYESAGNLVAVLRPLISPNNTINANPGNNSLVITDYADNLNRLGKIISALDAPATGDMDVVPVRYAIAADIAVMINKLMETGAAAPGTDSGRVNLIADSRTNAVIVRAPSLARANLAKSLIAKLDQPTAQPGNVHVVYLKNADATKLALTLRSVVGSDGQAPSSHQSASAASPMQNVSGAMPGSMPPSVAPDVLSSGGSAGFIQADTATNTLIITASEPVYRNLRTVIDQLDVRRAQVYIESLIVEVTADKAAEFGIQWLGLSGNSGSNYRVGGGTSFSSGGNNLVSQAIAANTTGGSPLPPGAGLTLGVFRQINGALGLGALARALESDANTNILSTPNLITLDNEEAKIIVGQNVPFITGQYTTQASGGGAGVNPFQTIERKDVGLSLRVRPQISEGGTVKMAIYQETSAVQSTANAAGIITSKRSIETNVLADDGQIIVLGGLIEDTVGDGVDKVPLLGDIPIIGNLFKYQKRSRKKTNLMVFLRPTIIRSNTQSASVVADRYDYIRGTEIAAQPARSAVLPNTGTPILPPLENGRPIGGTFLRPIPAVPAPAAVPEPMQ